MRNPASSGPLFSPPRPRNRTLEPNTLTVSSVPLRIAELMVDRTAGQAFFGCNMAAASAPCGWPRGGGMATSRRRLVLPVLWRTSVRCHVSGASGTVQCCSPPTEDVLGEMPPTEAIQELGLPVESGDRPAELTQEIAAGIVSGAGGGCGDDGMGVAAAKLGAEKPFILQCRPNCLPGFSGENSLTWRSSSGTTLRPIVVRELLAYQTLIV